MLSGKGLCDELITRPEESHRLWCFVVCDLETSQVSRSWPNGDCCAKNKNKNPKIVVRLQGASKCVFMEQLTAMHTELL